MNSLPINRIGILGLVLLTAAPSVFAQVNPDKYAPLRAALASKKQEAMVGSEDAKFWVGEYSKFLKDPETATDEKPELRKNLIAQQSRERELQKQSSQIEAAINQLRKVPADGGPTLEEVQAAYDGLEQLGARGEMAWNELLNKRDSTIDFLQVEYDLALTEAQRAYDELNTEERANELLLNAIDHGRTESSDEEFRVALKLPNLKTTAALGFGILPKEDDPIAQAQATLIALIGYSQFFWDHYAGLRVGLGEEKVPADLTRNIFGVADGGVLTSDAISRNSSSVYYLSDSAKERFNRRLSAIWGPTTSLQVNRWDQNRAKSFHGACVALSTSEDEALVPNGHVFRILDEIDRLIEERRQAQLLIDGIHAEFREKLALAKHFGDRASLSAAHFNAQRLEKDSESTITRFKAALKLLDSELDQCANEDWTPKANGIAASAQALSTTSKRVELVRAVKHKLTILLEKDGEVQPQE